MIIENLIPIEQQNELETIMTADVFPWYFNSTTVNGNLDSGFQFVHRVFDDRKVISNLFTKLTPLMDNFQRHTGLEITEIVRIKANLLVQASLSLDTIMNTFHRDVESETDDSCISMIYYVTPSDGDTIILGKNSIKPIKGRACFFNSVLMHRASNPVNYQRRIILNFVFRVK